MRRRLRRTRPDAAHASNESRAHGGRCTHPPADRGGGYVNGTHSGRAAPAMDSTFEVVVHEMRCPLVDDSSFNEIDN